jgi:hypothetical protein
MTGDTWLALFILAVWASALALGITNHRGSKHD